VLRSALLAHEIECEIHYPVPLHLQPTCRALGYRAGDFPESEQAADAVLSLPMHPHLKKAELKQVANIVMRALIGDHGLFAGEWYTRRRAFPLRAVSEVRLPANSKSKKPFPRRLTL
jgi:hypothetical protein